MNTRLWIPALVVALVPSSYVFAQEVPVVPRTGERVRETIRENRADREDRRDDRAGERDAARTAEQRKFENMDQLMVAWLVPCNEEEVILGKIAQQRSQNDKVKQFAAQMVADHSKALEELRKFGNVETTLGDTRAADQAATAPPASRGERVDTPPATTGEAVRDNVREVVREVGDVVRSVVGYTDSADAIQIKQEIHRECLALTQAELDKHQGAEFDKCYLGTQIGAHMGMLATLKTFERNASDEMRPAIQQARATTEQHLNHAKELMKELDRPSTARRPAAERVPE